MMGTRKAALGRMNHFLEFGLPRYEEDRNHPDKQGGSGLSPWLHFGKNSWDVFGRSFVLTSVFFLSTRMAAKASTVQLAAHQILLQLWLFSSFFTDGVAMTGTILGAAHAIHVQYALVVARW